MPNPVTVTVAGVGNSNPVVLDQRIAPFEVSVGVAVVSGAINATLQYTYDDPFQAGGIVNWTNYPQMTGITAAGDCVINGGPVTAVRLANAGTGTLQARVIQSG